MSLRLSTSQSAHHVSLWGGLGIPGAEVPTTGDNGGSPLANDGISPTSEYRIETVTAPSAGTMTVFPDTSYLFEGAADGSYPWVYRVFEDSIDRGTATETLVIGSPVASFATTTALPAFSGSASIAGASPVAVFNTTTALPTFSGSASVAGTPAVFSFATTTSLPTFSGGAVVAGIVWPATSDVRLGVTYGPTGSEYTGTMTGGSGPSASDIAAAVVAALGATTIPVNVQQINSKPLTGSGTPADPMRPA
jgi:hypothetical protein